MDQKYTRIFDKNQVENSKYTSIVDVSSNSDCISVVEPPSRVTFDIQKKPVLNRPVLSKQSHSRSTYSNSTYTSLGKSIFGNTSISVSRSQPAIPFLTLSNSLKLHLKLNVLESDERIIAWIPGSFLIQFDPFVALETQFSLFNGFFKSQNPGSIDAPKLFLPAYLLLTNNHIYIYRPKFRLCNLKAPLEDEQTTYFDPSCLIHLQIKIRLVDIARIDVGPGRQYLVFRANQTLSTQKQKPKLISLLFHCRSKQSCTLIIDSITATMLEESKNEILSSRHLINQDVEFCMRNIQDTVLLRPGLKNTNILHYDSVWNNERMSLSENEFDRGLGESISKVDFDFARIYLFGVYLRYTRPVLETDCRGVEIQHVTVFGTNDYIYLFEERLDAWPPALIPDEFSPHPTLNASIENILSSSIKKGLMIDKIPQIHCLLGVGRIADICQIERWRTWRIDDALTTNGGNAVDFDGLGIALQNGVIGHLRSEKRSSQQQGTLSGWFWWIRITFGELMPGKRLNTPNEAPKTIPQSSEELKVNYWWDVAFSSRESADDFIDSIRVLKRTGVHFILGDD